MMSPTLKGDSRFKVLRKAVAALPKQRSSTRNLAHYIGLRKQDVHRLQLELAAVGLSSLGRCEGHVADTLMRLGAWRSAKRALALADPADDEIDRARRERLLHTNTEALLGARPRDRGWSHRNGSAHLFRDRGKRVIQ
jgi:pyruvate kinase